MLFVRSVLIFIALVSFVVGALQTVVWVKGDVLVGVFVETTLTKFEGGKKWQWTAHEPSVHLFRDRMRMKLPWQYGDMSTSRDWTGIEGFSLPASTGNDRSRVEAIEMRVMFPNQGVMYRDFGFVVSPSSLAGAQYVFVVVPAWFTISISWLLVGVVLAVNLKPLLRRRRRRMLDQCMSCGYSLHALVMGHDGRLTCPECGCVSK